jgi:hypothetical protein
MGYELSGKQKPACEECGKHYTEYNSNDRVCSNECARARKTRLQRERRQEGIRTANERATAWYKQQRARSRAD